MAALLVVSWVTAAAASVASGCWPQRGQGGQGGVGGYGIRECRHGFNQPFEVFDE